MYPGQADTTLEVVPLILAGGRGARLWPLSRAAFPKQLLPLIGERTMLQRTLERVARLRSPYKPIIVVCEEHRYLARRQLQAQGMLEGVDLVLEPLGRSTAPAICGSAHLALKKYGNDALLLVLPADHLIDDDEALREGFVKGTALAREGGIITFGIRPERPETGYGYIEGGAEGRILSFTEKPQAALAREYIQQGNYFWNSGMYLFRLDFFLQEMARFCPHMTSAMELAVQRGRQKGDFFRFDTQSMLDVEDLSIDYALMEKTAKAQVVPVELGWRDLGSWFAYWEEQTKDESGNVIQGEVLVDGVQDSCVLAGDKLVVCLGMNDLLLVESGDALLVGSLGASQKVKRVVERLQAERREEWLNRNFSSRSWGSYSLLEKGEQYVVRRVMLYPGARQRLQRHTHRSEHWVVISGTARVRRGQNVFLLYEDQSCVVPATIAHSLEIPGVIPLEICEVQVGSSAGDDDTLFISEEE